MIDEAADKLVYPEETKKEFISKTSLLIRIYKAVMPDPAANEFEQLCSLLRAIAEKLKPHNDADISHVIRDINGGGGGGGAYGQICGGGRVCYKREKTGARIEKQELFREQIG